MLLKNYKALRNNFESFFVLFVPYVMIFLVLEFIKSKYASKVSNEHVAIILVTVILGLLAVLVYSKSIQKVFI